MEAELAQLRSMQQNAAKAKEDSVKEMAAMATAKRELAQERAALEAMKGNLEQQRSELLTAMSSLPTMDPQVKILLKCP